jgi:hypothetical protein
MLKADVSTPNPAQSPQGIPFPSASSPPPISGSNPSRRPRSPVEEAITNINHATREHEQEKRKRQIKTEKYSGPKIKAQSRANCGPVTPTATFRQGNVPNVLGAGNIRGPNNNNPAGHNAHPPTLTAADPANLEMTHSIVSLRAADGRSKPLLLIMSRVRYVGGSSCFST